MGDAFGLVADYGLSSSDDDDQNAPIEELTKSGKPEDKSVKEENFCMSSTDAKSNNYFSLTNEPLECESKKKAKKKRKIDTSQLAIENPLRSDAPDQSSSSSMQSVFYNPFLKAEEAKEAVLEKHVKLTDNPKYVLSINGKKICWNYRKGKCRFGRNCKYAHDSDIVGDLSYPSNDAHKETFEIKSKNFPNSSPKKKKRSGLSQALVPGKKIRKIFEAEQLKERPWVLNR